jgi:hypothetical protein
MQHDPQRLWAAAVCLALIFLSGAGATARADEPLRLPAGDAALFDAIDLSRPDLAELKLAVAHQDWPAARAAWAAHLAARTSPRWLWSRHDRAAIIDVFARDFGGLGKFVPAADRVLARQFSAQGVAKTLAKDPQWDQGPLEWTHVLSRFAYLNTLGKAYWATGDPKYPADFVYLLEHWVADNPAPDEVVKGATTMGSRWRTLETGIRGYAWWDDIEFFMDAPEFDPAAKAIVTRSLVEHARRLYAYETRFRQGNWQVCECTGLACIGIMLPEMREAAGWRDRALSMLAEHMRRDVYPDGAHWELTPGYHAWVTSEFLLAARLCQINHVAAPPDLLARHQRMYEFLMRMAKPDRLTFPVGDDGSGTDVGLSMATGALLYGRADMRWLAPPRAPEDLVWQFGPGVVDRYAGLTARPPDPSSYMMPDAHFALMRTGWAPADKCLLFNCAPWGGGHDHRDRLEVCLYAGRDLILDPGQIPYDRPLSGTYFRTTAAHSVMTIDGRELPAAGPRVQAWSSGPTADFASAALDYDGLRQQRSVLFVRPDYWVVVDRASRSAGPPATGPTTVPVTAGRHLLRRSFHFPVGDAGTDGPAAYTTAADRPNIAVIDADGTPAEIGSGWVPTGGATPAHDPVAVFTNRDSLPAVRCTVLVPIGSAAQRPDVRREADGAPQTVHIHVRFPDGRDDDLVVGDGEHPADLTAGDAHATGWAVGVSHGPAGRRSIVAAP